MALFDFDRDGDVTGMESFIEVFTYIILAKKVCDFFMRKKETSAVSSDAYEDVESYYLEEYDDCTESEIRDKVLYDTWQLSKIGLDRANLKTLKEEERNQILIMHGFDPQDFYFI